VDSIHNEAIFTNPYTQIAASEVGDVPYMVKFVPCRFISQGINGRVRVKVGVIEVKRYLPIIPLPLYAFSICDGFYCLHVVFHVWILKRIDVILTLQYAVQSDDWFDGTNFTIYGVI